MNINEPPSLLRNDVSGDRALAESEAGGNALERQRHRRSGHRGVRRHAGRRRRVLASSGYLSSGDRRLHFGLGAATTADLEIAWPNGTRETVKSVRCRSVGHCERRRWSSREGAISPMTRFVTAYLFVSDRGRNLSGAGSARADADPHLARGMQLMQQQLFEAAANEFQQAVTRDPANPRARFELAVCLLVSWAAMRKHAASSRSFRSRPANRATSLTTSAGSTSYRTITNRPSSASDRSPKHPPFPDTAFYLGTAYISSGNVTEGISWLERAAKLLPHDYRVHYRLARAYSSAGREQEANHEYSLYAQYKDEHKNTEKDVRDCTTALRTRPLTEAREICHRMFDATNPEKLTLLGQLFGDAGAFADAVDPLSAGDASRSWLVRGMA